MPQPEWIWQYDRTVPSEIGAIGTVRREVLTEVAQRNWGKHDLFSIHLALDEALVNAMKHGNRLDPDKRVHVLCRMSNDLLQIEVCDQGAGFDPASIPDPTEEGRIDCPGGRGIMLMRSFMDRVEYNGPGNRVLLEKRRSPGE